MDTHPIARALMSQSGRRSSVSTGRARPCVQGCSWFGSLDPDSSRAHAAHWTRYYVPRARGTRLSAQDDDLTIDPELTRAALGVTSAITEGPPNRLRQGSGDQEAELHADGPAQAGHYDRSFAPGAIIGGRYRLVAL